MLILKTIGHESITAGAFPADPAGHGGRDPGQRGLVLPGPAPAGAAGLDRGRVGSTENNGEAKYYKLTKAGRIQLQGEAD